MLRIGDAQHTIHIERHNSENTKRIIQIGPKTIREINSENTTREIHIGRNTNHKSQNGKYKSQNKETNKKQVGEYTTENTSRATYIEHTNRKSTRRKIQIENTIQANTN